MEASSRSITKEYSNGKSGKKSKKDRIKKAGGRDGGAC